MNTMNRHLEPADFSLVLGGPLYRFWLRIGLADDTLELVGRRIVLLAGLGWVPLLLLSIAAGQAWGASVALPFLHDIEIHLRLLVAVPLLLIAELIVHRRMGAVARQFVERGLISDSGWERFEAAIASVVRLRNSKTAEALLIAFVYGVGVLFIWRTQVALDLRSWYGTHAGGILQPSLAGWWFGLVSLPLFQFLLLRWYFRLFIWARFLWRVSRIDLNFMPDGAGGAGFLARASYAFQPLLLAQGVLLAGTIANRIFYTGAELLEFKPELIGMVAVMIFVILGPLLFFSPKLEAAKRAGLRQYGTLVERYMREFDDKWVRGTTALDEPLVGSPDIQSLADLGNSYAVVKTMRWVPFTLQNILYMAATALLPVLPLTLTMFPVEELLDRLLKILF